MHHGHACRQPRAIQDPLPIPLLLTIAIQQLLAYRRQTIITVSGMMVGVTVVLVTLSLFGGLLDSFTRKILNVAPHVTMTAVSVRGVGTELLLDVPPHSAIELARNVEPLERLRVPNVMKLLREVEQALGNRLTAASPYLSTQVLAAYGTGNATLPVVGVIPKREAMMSDLTKYLRSGSVARLEATHDGMLIGAKAASDLGVDFGDRLQLVSATGDVVPVRVVGVYRLGMGESDRAAFVNLRLAQTLDRALPSEATGIGFQLRNVDDAPAAALEIEAITGRKTDTWQQTNADAISIFVLRQMLVYAVVGFVIVICGFGVANILITIVLEKRRDIAVMRSFGLSRSRLFRMYLLQGLVIAITGSILGCAIGAVAIGLMGTMPVGAGVAAVETRTLQMAWSPWYFVAAVASTLVAGAVASIAPARTAASLVPADVLRGGHP
ncbi:MAG: ABC transporter permease [Bacteroidetes bacterium]|nr:ABC transporter permease [Bacteroidota bacterium]